MNENAVIIGISTSIALLVVSAWIAIKFILTLPTDYLTNDKYKTLVKPQTTKEWTNVIIKNILGVILVISGVVMLITPGQGVLTILIGIMLLDFPGRYNLELKILKNPTTLKQINQIRRRYNKDDLAI